MKQVLIVVAAFLLGGAAFAGVALAAGTAQAPNARLAVYVDGGDTPGSFSVPRKKGVTSVTNPLTGVYCIKPSNPDVTLSKIVPVVSMEYSGTASADSRAAWSSLNIYCPSGTIEVDTYHLSDLNHVNNVAFTLTVF
jgi:hypothetical protein